VTPFQQAVSMLTQQDFPIGLGSIPLPENRKRLVTAARWYADLWLNNALEATRNWCSADIHSVAILADQFKSANVFTFPKRGTLRLLSAIRA
jgi:hypothetical protein